ncbi:imelysin family protein [Delftia sp. PS-11]|uniref:imelysin family protein n=1 Tax=Delftia sp. PS-11 TaxID=2767222 RepID=UPI002456C4A3|nr:imelysin family protein [Delftia sp. PS-11]KAJ8746377.1 iron-regulated protein [Delftia sp. PS-11]
MQSILIAAALALGAAVPMSQATAAGTAQQPVKKSLSAPEVVRHYGTLVHANYADSIASAKTMRRAIQAFLSAPSEQGLQRARQAWIDAREYYGQTEAFRFYAGPIDNDDGPEGQINAWPMDESYVDYVEGNPDAGIINNRKQAITKKRLAELNEHDGEENVSTGWHAIEFMLWGQDLSDQGPGNRPYTDYVDGKKPNADRRRQYLKVVTELLIDDLQSVADQWKPGVAGNFRARFEKTPEDALRRIFVGLGSLSRGELAGERLEVAMASRDQEDEHSCFSDNTHRDAVANAQGILNVWLGRYRRLDGSVLQGPGIRDWVAARDSALADRTTRQIAQSVEAAQAIPAPFDQAIQGARDAASRTRIQATIDSLVQQSKDLVDAASAVGIAQLNLVDPKAP